jgi:hypothetical protein
LFQDKCEGGSDLWNPNDLIDAIISSNDVEEKKKLKKELIGRFLEQQRPMLTARMREFLVEEGNKETTLMFTFRDNGSSFQFCDSRQ